MTDLNIILIEGNLVHDPQERRTGSEAGSDKIASFSIGNNRKMGDTEESSFFDVVAFGKLADIVLQYKKKGDKIRVTGRLKQSTWTDKEGNKRSKIGIIAERVDFLWSKQAAEQGGEARQAPPQEPRQSKGRAAKPQADEQTDDEIPF